MSLSNFVFSAPSNFAMLFVSKYTKTDMPSDWTGFAHTVGDKLLVNFVSEGFNSEGADSLRATFSLEIIGEWERDQSYVEALIDAFFSESQARSFTFLFSKDSSVTKHLIVDTVRAVFFCAFA